MSDIGVHLSKSLSRTLGCVLVVGAMAAGTVAATSAIANAQPVPLPGGGNFDIPSSPALMSLLQPTIAPLHIPPPDRMSAVPFKSPASVVSQLNADPIEQAPLPLPASTQGQQALAAAESKLGAPYVWGAAGPGSFDCSGLAQWAYMQAGVSIPRTTYDQAVGGVPVSAQDLELGDLVLFYGGEHVGLYAGNGEVVHAPASGQSVKRAPLDSMPFYRARRY